LIDLFNQVSEHLIQFLVFQLKAKSVIS